MAYLGGNTTNCHIKHCKIMLKSCDNCIFVLIEKERQKRRNEVIERLNVVISCCLSPVIFNKLRVEMKIFDIKCAMKQFLVRRVD